MIRNRKKSLLMFFILLLVLISCSSATISNSERNKRKKNIMQFYKVWKGTPYKLGGTTRKGIDCSAFIQKMYSEKFKINLPRTVEGMSTKGSKVKNRKDWEVGDLIFFKIGKRKVNHVGVYIGDNKFVHASVSKGVMISEYSPYWKRYFWQTRKVL